MACASAAIQTPQGTPVLKTGNGSTVNLANQLHSAGLGCSDYKDVPQTLENLSAGIKDIGNCSVGHLGAFSSRSVRDQWVSTQLTMVKMAGCVEGSIWAVCVFPKDKVSRAQVQSALSGFTTS